MAKTVTSSRAVQKGETAPQNLHEVETRVSFLDGTWPVAVVVLNSIQNKEVAAVRIPGVVPRPVWNAMVRSAWGKCCIGRFEQKHKD
jgi:hypothetical protein